MGNRFIVFLIYIMRVLMVICVCEPGESVPGMIKDLSDTDASFVGEDSSDRYGCSVTGLLDQGRDRY